MFWSNVCITCYETGHESDHVVHWWPFITGSSAWGCQDNILYKINFPDQRVSSHKRVPEDKFNPYIYMLSIYSKLYIMFVYVDRFWSDMWPGCTSPVGGGTWVIRHDGKYPQLNNIYCKRLMLVAVLFGGFVNITIWQRFNLKILYYWKKVVRVHIFFIWWLLILANFINSPISPNKSLPLINRFKVSTVNSVSKSQFSNSFWRLVFSHLWFRMHLQLQCV